MPDPSLADTDTANAVRRKRRIMTEFVINELSAVDAPAMEGAKMVIMKRHQPALAKELQPMPSINVARKVEPPQAPTDIMDVVAAIAARDSVSKFQAMSLAAVERPDLLAKFQAAPLPPLAKAAPMPPAVAGFNKRIDEIRRRDGCSRIEAMEKARVEHADEFAAYRVA